MNSTKNLIGKQRGVTMIEACITLAIAGILAGSALPSFKESLDKRRVEGLSSEVGTDLRYARSEAVARNTGVRVSFYQGCYVVHTGSRADCQCDGQGPAVCTGDAVALKTVNAGPPEATTSPLTFTRCTDSTSSVLINSFNAGSIRS